jgi:hypothetical protein
MLALTLNLACPGPMTVEEVTTIHGTVLVVAHAQPAGIETGIE